MFSSELKKGSTEMLQRTAGQSRSGARMAGSCSTDPAPIRCFPRRSAPYLRFWPATPRLLFELKAGDYDSTAPVRSWSATADGQRFLLSRFI